MICFYHSADHDGHCSGAIVKHTYPHCEMIGIDYGDEFPWDKVEGQEVFMVDFSLPIDDMVKLSKMCELVWIDHHISAMKAYQDRSFFIRGRRDETLAACEITWQWFHAKPMPRMVRLCGRYDVWDHDADSGILSLHYGLMLYPTDPVKNMKRWELWFDGFPQYICDKGLTVLDYMEMHNNDCAAAMAFEVVFDQLRCIAINKGLTNSKVFDSVYDPERHDAMLAFSFHKNKWRYSLYATNEDVDVSIVAKERGGGGHKGAAGFQSDEMLIQLPSKEN